MIRRAGLIFVVVNTYLPSSTLDFMKSSEKPSAARKIYAYPELIDPFHLFF